MNKVVTWSGEEFIDNWTKEWLSKVVVIRYEHDIENKIYIITYKEV